MGIRKTIASTNLVLPGLGALEALSLRADLLLVLLLPLLGLLLGDLAGLEALADHPELLLEVHDLVLAGVGALLGPGEVTLDHGELAGDLVVLDVRLLDHLLGLLDLVLQDVNS